MVELPTPEEFHGKVAVVTGGTRGIGRAIAVAFAELGCRVTACYLSDSDTAEALSADMRRSGWDFEAVQADVGYAAGAAALIEGVAARRGRLDILVNNAGIFPRRAALEIGDDEWERVLRSNLYSTFYCMRAVVPAMALGGGGAIVNLASIAGKRGSAYHASYAAAKGGVLALTRSFAKEVIVHGVRVNAVCPGRVATEIFGAQMTPEERQRFLREAPIGRLGTAEEVASAVVFLCSRASAYIVGETLDVDGGVLMD